MMVAPENRDHVAALTPEALAGALRPLLGDAALRARLGGVHDGAHAIALANQHAREDAHVAHGRVVLAASG